MKRFTYLCLPLLAACFLLMAGCSDDNKEPDDILWDFANSSFYFHLVDEEGDNLWNPEHPNNLLDEEVYIDYKGKKFLRATPDQPTPRFNMPNPLALSLIEDVQKPRAVVAFGEFSPTENYKNETFIAHWGKGRKSEVKFDYYITWKKNKPTVHHKIYVDGKLCAEDNPENSIYSFPPIWVVLK